MAPDVWAILGSSISRGSSRSSGFTILVNLTQAVAVAKEAGTTPVRFTIGFRILCQVLLMLPIPVPLIP